MLFTEMDLETRTQLVSMVNAETRTSLESQLSDAEQKELYFYENFTMKENTNATSKEFIDKLV